MLPSLNFLYMMKVQDFVYPSIKLLVHSFTIHLYSIHFKWGIPILGKGDIWIRVATAKCNIALLFSNTVSTLFDNNNNNNNNNNKS